MTRREVLFSRFADREGCVDGKSFSGPETNQSAKTAGPVFIKKPTAGLFCWWLVGGVGGFFLFGGAGW